MTASWSWVRGGVLLVLAVGVALGACDAEGEVTGDVVSCPAGSEGCACTGAGGCAGDGLECASGLCVARACATGTLGCECFGNGSCMAGLECALGLCAEPRCEAGTLGCGCLSDGSCGGGLVCLEAMCVQAPCPAGTEGCPCDAGACGTGLECDSDLCEPVTCTVGTLGCPCFGNLTCSVGLECDVAGGSVCTEPSCPAGTEGCPCTSEGACDGVLVCSGPGAAARCELPVECPAGTEGCPCEAGACGDGLFCEAGDCKQLLCTQGELDCLCDAGACLGDGVVCGQDGWCAQAPCPAGTEGCPCTAKGACGVNGLGEEMACNGAGLCEAASCVPGTTGCPCAWGAECAWAEDVCQAGYCLEVGCAPGKLHCACLGGGCLSGLTCRDGVVCVDPTGYLGGKCHADGTCEYGFKCQGGTCASCAPGLDAGCACGLGGACASGLTCWDGQCVDVATTTLPPAQPVCYTPCKQALVTEAGTYVPCAANGYMAGCYGGTTCKSGSCGLPTDDGLACAGDIDCPEHQACIKGYCYSNCATDGDCKGADETCYKHVCRSACTTTGDGCPSGHACVAGDGASGACMPVAVPGDEAQTVQTATFTLSKTDFALTGLDSEGAFVLTNASPKPATFLVRKRSHKRYHASGDLDSVVDYHDAEACDPLIDCPLAWLELGLGSDTPSPTQALEVTVGAGASATVTFDLGVGTDVPRWDGVLEVRSDGLGVQLVTLNYSESPEGRWRGKVYYFSTFADDGLEAWAASSASKDSPTLIKEVGNAFVQQWAAFRTGNMSWDKMQAVLLATETESWRWNGTVAACTATKGACYLHDSTSSGVVVYSSDLASAPIPTGVVEMPFAANLYEDAASAPGVLKGRIESSLTLHYGGDPALTLDLGSDPTGCERTSGGVCLVLLDGLDADVYLGGRYESTATDTKCSKRTGGYYQHVQIPWLLPDFTRGTTYDAAAMARYRYECRDTLLPLSPADGEALSTSDAQLNRSLAVSNPIPDAKTRRRKLALVDGALINQDTLFVLFRETFESFLPGDGEDFHAYGYMVLRREPTELDTTDADGDQVPDVYQGAVPSDPRPDPADLLGVTCSPSLVAEALEDAATTTVTDANAAELALTLITGRRASATEDTITAASDEVVHYLCHGNGLFNGGPFDEGSKFTPITNDDSCGMDASAFVYDAKLKANVSPYANNGVCDDGGTGSETTICPIGTDKTDCATIRTSADVNQREACPAGSAVTFFTTNASVTKQVVASQACQTTGTCKATYDKWLADGTIVQVDPNWTCTDPDEVYCDGNRLDLTDGKTFFSKYDPATVFLGLYPEIKLAFRYKTHFQNRDGSTPGFVPEICGDDLKAIPYCYDPVAIEAIRDRVDCLLYLWEHHYEAIDAATQVTDGSGITARTHLDEFLCSSFAYTEACVPTSGATVHDGFERLSTELLVMLGDEAYTKAFASRFDLAGSSPVSFEGSKFEHGGSDYSGTAGYEMYSLYQATQYYQEALDRFFALSPSVVGALSPAHLNTTRNFVTQETVTRYFERLIRASTQKSRAWSQIAQRYHGFNEPALARRVVERAYTATYMESILLSRLMLRIWDSLQAEDKPQVIAVLEDSQRRYRMAMLDMQNVYQTLSDDLRFFGLPPDYIPFPTLNPNGFEDTAFEVLINRAKQKTETARLREDIALDRSRAFETDASEFQSELVRLRNNYENQLGDLCGTFVAEDGKVYPAIGKYAELDPKLAQLQSPCGLAGNGQIDQALGRFEQTRIDMEQVRTQLDNIEQEAEIERSRVEAQCNLILTNADYRFVQNQKIHSWQDAITKARATMAGIDRSIGTVSTLAQLGKCDTDCPSGLTMTGVFKAYAVTANVAAAATEAGIAYAEQEMNQIERETARWETEQQCDAALIDADARMATILLRTKEIELEALKLDYQMRLDLGNLKGLTNQARRLEDELTETQSMAIDVFAARNDPNVRIYRDDAIVNAELAFEDALKEAYRATKVLEYYTSQSYGALEQLFLIRMVQFGDYNLQNYLTQLENAFFEFEETYGNPDLRVALVSLRDDILRIPTLDDDGKALTQNQRIALMREKLKDPTLLDSAGYLRVPFPTNFDKLSPLTRIHKIFFIESEIIGSNVGDTVGRLYLRSKGTSVVHGLEDAKTYYRFPQLTAVMNPYFNGNRIFDTDVYRSYRFRERPFVNTEWELLINQRDELVNQDLDLQSLTDIRLYVYYRDFTAL